MPSIVEFLEFSRYMSSTWQSEFTQYFEPPTCPNLEKRWAKLFDNMTQLNNYGEMKIGERIYLKLVFRPIIGLRLWLVEANRFETNILIKNPYNNPVVKDLFGHNNAIFVYKDTVFAGAVMNRSFDIQVVRAIIERYQIEFLIKIRSIVNS